MIKNKLNKYCDPIKSDNHEITNSITSFSFFIFALIFFIISKNKIRHIPFLILSIILSISTLLCHSFLPNNYFWTEILAFNISYSIFISYFICYIINNFKYYHWLCLGMTLYLIGMYYIVFLNLLNAFKKDLEKESDEKKIFISLGLFFIKPLMIATIFGFGYFLIKNWNIILTSNLYKISILILIILFIIGFSLWPYSLQNKNKDCHMKFPFHATFHVLAAIIITLFYAIINHFE